MVLCLSLIFEAAALVIMCVVDVRLYLSTLLSRDHLSSSTLVSTDALPGTSLCVN